MSQEASLYDRIPGSKSRHEPFTRIRSHRPATGRLPDHAISKTGFSHNSLQGYDDQMDELSIRNDEKISKTLTLRTLDVQ
jgi:hypothetical protein